MRRLVALALALLLPASAFAQDDDGGGFLERLLEDNLSGAGRDVQIAGFAGALSSQATIERLTIADAEGVWLTLEDVVLDWRRAALLSGRVEVNRLTAGRIMLPRLPVSEESNLPDPEASGFRLPELPVSVNIGEISAPDVEIGEPVFGIESTFSLNGSLGLEGGDGSADISVVRLDDPEGVFDIEASFANSTRTLDMSVKLSEAPAGIVATLAGLPGAPAVDLTLEGQGPLDDFSASLLLSTDGTERLAGTLAIGGEGTTDGGPLPFRAEVGGDIAPLFAPDYADFFGNEVALVVGGVRASDGALDLRTFSLDAREITLDGRLQLAPGGLPTSFDLVGEIASQDGEPVLLPIPGERTEVRSIGLNATFDAALGDAWTGRFEILGLDRPGLSAESIVLDGNGTITAAGAYSANLDFSAEALDLGDPEVGGALGERVTGRIEVSGDPDAPLDISRLDVNGETYAVSGAAVLDIQDRDLAVEGRATASVENLSVFSGIAGRTLGGSAELSLAGSGQILGGAFDLSVDGRTDDLSVDIAEVDNLVAGTTRLSIAAKRDTDGISLDTFRLGSAAAQITAEGAIRTDATRLNLSGTLQDGALVLPGLDGLHSLALIAEDVGDVWNIRSSLQGATLSASLLGELDDSTEVPAFDGRVTLDAASLAPVGPLIGLPDLVGALALRFEGNVSGDLAAFDATLSASGEGVRTGIAELDPLLRSDVSLSLDTFREDGTIRIREFKAATGTISASADGTLSGMPVKLVPFDADALLASPPEFEGRAELSASDLSPAAGIAGLPGLRGGVRAALGGQAVFDLSALDIDLTFEGSNLGVGLPDLDPLLEGGVSADLSAMRSGGGPLDLARLRMSTETIDAAGQGTISGLPGALVPMDTDALLETAAFDGTIEVSARSLSPLGPLSGLPGLSGAVELDLEGSLAANLEELDIRLDANGANIRTGIAAVDEYIRGGTVLALDVARSEGRFDIRRGRFASTGLSAQMEGTIGPRDGDVRATARLDDLGRIVDGLSGQATADIAASRSPGADWTIDARIDGPGGLTAVAEGAVSPEFDNFDLDLTGNAPLGLANAFIAPRSLGGQAAFDLRLDGRPALSSLTGRVTTSDARLVAPTLGIIVERTDATVTLSGQQAVLDVRGNVDGGGVVTVRGPIGLAPPMNADLDINLASVRVSDPQLYETTVSGDVTIDGALSGGASIAGRIDVGRTEIRIPSGVSGGVAPIPEIAHVSEPAGVRETRARAGLLSEPGDGNGGQGGGPAYPLDLRIVATNQIFIRGRGLDAELGGSFRITGTSANVIPQGQLSLIRGRLDLLGKRLVLVEGAIAVEGDFDPYLRLVAVSQAGDVTVRIIVEGPVSAPEISFLSDPELPEDEVVAQLLFGRGIQNLSPFQAAQLATAVATLTGGGDGVLGNLRKGFGLDDLNVTSDEDGGLAVTAGKYLSDNLYTDVTVGSDGETQIELNLDLTPSVTVTGRTSTTGESGIGIHYERDY